MPDIHTYMMFTILSSLYFIFIQKYYLSERNYFLGINQKLNIFFVLHAYFSPKGRPPLPPPVYVYEHLNTRYSRIFSITFFIFQNFQRNTVIFSIEPSYLFTFQGRINYECISGTNNKYNNKVCGRVYFLFSFYLYLTYFIIT